jgi:hypothetical protein
MAETGKRDRFADAGYTVPEKRDEMQGRELSGSTIPATRTRRPKRYPSHLADRLIWFSAPRVIE